MAARASSEIGPPTDTWYKHRVRLLSSVRDAWRARELVRTLAERDIRARYKQATLGLAWATRAGILQHAKPFIPPWTHRQGALRCVVHHDALPV